MGMYQLAQSQSLVKMQCIGALTLRPNDLVTYAFDCRCAASGGGGPCISIALQTRRRAHRLFAYQNGTRKSDERTKDLPRAVCGGRHRRREVMSWDLTGELDGLAEEISKELLKGVA